MAGIRHSTVVAVPDDGTSPVGTNEWNADHVIDDASIAGAKLSDAALSAIAALTPAADRMPYYTGASAAALATLSSFIRTLLDDADAATALATLGAAALASPTFTGTPAAPTPSFGDSTTKVATTAFVENRETFTRLSSNNTGFTNSITDVANLTVAVAANEVREVEWQLLVTTSSTNGVVWQWSGDGADGSFLWFFGQTSGVTAFNWQFKGEASNTTSMQTTAITAPLLVKGLYINGAAPTTLKLRGTSGGAGTTVTVLSKSFVRSRRVA